LKHLVYHIAQRISGTLLALLAVAFVAVAQKDVPYVNAEQCDTIEFSVVDWPGDRYTWNIYSDSTLNFAHEDGELDPAAYFVDGDYGGATVQVTGLPVGRYFIRVMVWDENTCTNNLMLFMLDIEPHMPFAELYPDSVCYGEPMKFKIVFTGTGPWEVIYTYGDGTTHLNLNGIENEKEFTPPIPPLPVGPTEFWILEVRDECTVNGQTFERVKAFIYPKPKGSQIYQLDK